MTATTAVRPHGPRTRRGRPAPRRTPLLTCAVRAFTERGYEGTSMEYLAGRLGVTKSTIYHHVPGKTELLRMALDEAARTLFALAEKAAAESRPGAGELAALVRSVLRLPDEELLYVELLLSTRDDQEGAREVLRRRWAFEEHVAELVRRSAAGDGARRAVPADVRARLLLDMLRSLIVQRRTGTLPAAPGTADALADLVTGCAR